MQGQFCKKLMNCSISCARKDHSAWSTGDLESLESLDPSSMQDLYLGIDLCNIYFFTLPIFVDSRTQKDQNRIYKCMIVIRGLIPHTE